MPGSPVAKIASKSGSVAGEKRFAFGKNWQRFLKGFNDQRIAEAERSLREMLTVQNLRNHSFLDIGSGSGLFSLAAMRLAAARVHSFDFDSQSVACTEELKRRYFPEAGNWTIEQGSVLDSGYLSGLGQFDVVYSWGVLHHTGDMWHALENVIGAVAPGGTLFIALYNDQGLASRVWKTIKRLYSRWAGLRPFFLAFFSSYFVLRGLAKDLLILRRNPLRRYREYHSSRGMAFWPDRIDWIGGYPFEVANPGQVFDFYRERGFRLVRLKAAGYGRGCNEFVFRKG